MKKSKKDIREFASVRLRNGEIKFIDIKPYLNFKVVSIRPLSDNEIRIEYKKESK